MTHAGAKPHRHGRDLSRRSHAPAVRGHTYDQTMKNDIAVAHRLGITATTLEGILNCEKCRYISEFIVDN